MDAKHVGFFSHWARLRPLRQRGLYFGRSFYRHPCENWKTTSVCCATNPTGVMIFPVSEELTLSDADIMFFLPRCCAWNAMLSSVVREFWLTLSESRFLELVDGALILETFASLMRSLSPTTSCLRDLSVPIDLKLPEAVKPLLYSVVVHKSPSNCVRANFAIVFPRLKLLLPEGNTRMGYSCHESRFTLTITKCGPRSSNCVICTPSPYHMHSSHLWILRLLLRLKCGPSCPTMTANATWNLTGDLTGAL